VPQLIGLLRETLGDCKKLRIGLAMPHSALFVLKVAPNLRLRARPFCVKKLRDERVYFSRVLSTLDLGVQLVAVHEFGDACLASIINRVESFPEL
jgi:hypothetical protein